VAGARDLWAVPTAALGHLAAPGSTDPTVRRATHGDRDGVAACYERVARSRPGWLRRDAAAWEAVGAEEPPAYRYVAARGETIVGFTAYRHTADPSEADTFGLRVGDLVAEDGAAEQALWRVFAAHGAQVPEIVVEGGTHEPVAHLLRELDVRVRQRRPWMTRLVDVAGAVAARGFPAAVSLRVELRVVDPRAPWNDGPWVLEVDGGQGRLAAGGSGAVTTTARALGPLYSGWSSAWRLAAAGELTGAAAEDLAGLDAAFAGPRPTMADYF
jgi:predicted acetyltransferase